MTPNDVVMYATVWVLSQICRPQEPLSAGRVRVRTCCECYNKRGYIRTWYVYKILFFIFHSLFFREVGTSLVQAYRPKFIQHRKFTPFYSRLDPDTIPRVTYHIMSDRSRTYLARIQNYFFMFHSLFFWEVGTSLVQAYRPKLFSIGSSRRFVRDRSWYHTSCHISHHVRSIMNIMWLISYHIPGSSWYHF